MFERETLDYAISCQYSDAAAMEWEAQQEYNDWLDSLPDDERAREIDERIQSERECV